MAEDLLAQFEDRYVRPKAGRTLIVGSRLYGNKPDRRARFADVIGVDMQPGPGVDLVLDLEAPPPADMKRFAHIECMSVLEHSRRPWLLAANLEKLLQPGGTLYLTVPFVWRFHGYPSDYWRFTAEGVKTLFPGVRWEVVRYAADRLRPDHYLRAEEDEEHRTSLPRCEVLAFGVRC